jgi:hypothetical protein
MAIPIIHDWEKYFHDHHEGLGSSYERVVLNRILMDVCEQYGVQSVLESPSFGFTGLSGINLVQLAKNGIRVHLQDHDEHRLRLINTLWQEMGLSPGSSLNPDYRHLDFADDEFDMSFSFSALWFTADLPAYLSGLARVTRKVMFISVPNRQGIGYRMQFRDYSPQRYPELRVGHIDPATIRFLLKRHGWTQQAAGFFDCPPWPDIGMAKEDFASRVIAKEKQAAMARPSIPRQNPVSILDHYMGRDPDFPLRMKKFRGVEAIAPDWFKRIWAHHYYMVYSSGGHES